MPTRTAAQRRAQSRRDYEAFLDECPSRAVLEAITSKWVTLVLAALDDGPLRYNELGRRIAGVTPKMLTQTLRALERDGLLTRTITPTVPVRVDYELTRLGRSLLDVVLSVKTWAESNVATIQRSRTRFDARSAGSKAG